MKKWKCPECGNLTDYISAKITGECIIDVDSNSTLNYWESTGASCEACGFEESHWREQHFIVVDTK
jgi:NMD protein affecting ribosome stability and mRNA decay